MERTGILALMGDLKLYGMRAAYDEVMAAGIKRQHEPARIVGVLLKAKIAEKQARARSEKWEPVFGEIERKTKKLERDSESN